MRPRLVRRAAVTAAVTAVALAGAGPAFAYILLSSNGATQPFPADTLSAAVSPGAAPSSSTALRVSWTAPATQTPTATFVVVRSTDNKPVCTVAASVTSCTDTNATVPGTTYSYTVQTVLPNTSWVSSTQTVTATTADVFAMTASGGAPVGQLTAGTVANLQVTALKGSPLTTDTTYTGLATTITGLSTSPGGTAPTFSPASGSALSFTSGVAPLKVTPTKAEKSVAVTVTDGRYSNGTSNTFDVVAGTASTMQLAGCKVNNATVPCSSAVTSLGSSGTFTAYVDIFDAYGNVPAATAVSITLTNNNTHFTLTGSPLTVTGTGTPVNQSSTTFQVAVNGTAGGTATITAKAPNFTDLTFSVSK